MENEKRIAILIDAENVLPFHADQVFSYARSLGIIVHKEIYGAAAAMNVWTEPILKYLIHTNLSIRTTKGKNTSDIALVIGAMDILATDNLDYFVIVSSDSDFSTLALRLRNAGATVIGIGSEPVNPLWKVACSEFVALEPTGNEAKLEMLTDEVSDEDSDSASKEDLLKAPGDAAERRQIIMKIIEEQITTSGGRISAPKLFLALNNLPAYQVDKQLSGYKKAQQYLLSAFSDRIHVENIDSVTWVILNNESNEAAENESNRVTTEADIPGSALSKMLTAKGIDLDVAQSIESIVRDTPKMISVYNRLRSLYGNINGSEYYRTLRDVLSSATGTHTKNDENN